MDEAQYQGFSIYFLIHVARPGWGIPAGFPARLVAGMKIDSFKKPFNGCFAFRGVLWIKLSAANHSARRYLAERQSAVSSSFVFHA